MKRNLLILLAVIGWTGQVLGADKPTPTPIPYPTATPFPCSYPYGVTVSGKNQPSNKWAYESPVSIGLTGQVDQVHVYSPQGETLVVGLYDGSENLVNAVTIQASRAGWQTANFPATIKPGPYYLAESGTAPNVNLVAGSGVSCFYNQSGVLAPTFQRSGSLPSGLPLYLTGCPPQAIQGLLFGAGDSVLGGSDITDGGKDYMVLLMDWLNQHYGPVQGQAYGAIAFDSSMLSGHVEFWLQNKNVSICVLGIGMNNLTNPGGPGSSRAGGTSLVSAFSSALIYGEDLQDLITVLRSHMPPGGILLITNLYRVQDIIDKVYGDWKDYDRVLRLYNDIVAMVAKANNAKVIDLYSIMASNPAYRYGPDMHPNSAGHSVIAVQMEKAVVEAGMPQGNAAPTAK
jgi:lysophospholipase L1-like esterase